MQAIGYAEAFAVLNNEMTMEEAKEKTVIRTRQLAKRQMTWFRNQLNVEWIDTAEFHLWKNWLKPLPVNGKSTAPTPVQCLNHEIH